jgi:VWFA-related protein
MRKIIRKKKGYMPNPVKPWLAALLLAAASLAAVAQQSPAQNPPAQTQKDDDQTIKVDVNVVSIFFNAKDKRGALLPDLGRDDFEVYEDGQKQAIKYFSAETNLPLTLGLLIDTSGSQERVLPMEQQVGAQFLRDVIREKDLAFLMNFDVNVELITDLTSSPQQLKRGLDTVRINTGGSGGGLPGMGGGPVPISNPRTTALYDAIYLAGREKLAREVGRKAMIILTDGQDYGSKVKIQEAIEAAQKSDSICYVLLIADRGFNGSLGYFALGYFGDGNMKKVTEETGGRMIEVGNDQRKLKEAFDQISAELRSQYSIGYTPTNTKHDGSYRKIEIKAKNAKVQSRKGYYAVKD